MMKKILLYFMKLNSAYLEDRFDENYSEYTEMFQTLLKPKKLNPIPRKLNQIPMMLIKKIIYSNII